MWNYRLFKEWNSIRQGWDFSIREVYYTDSKKIWLIGNSRAPYGEDFKDILANVTQMLQAFSRPVLDINKVKLAKEPQ